MQQNYRSKYNAHVIRIATVLVFLAAGGIGVRAMLVPESFGAYGHYRAGAIEDEMNRKVRNGTNAACLACHPYVKEMHFSCVRSFRRQPDYGQGFTGRPEEGKRNRGKD